MWILPSRGRPASVERFFDAWRKTGASTKGVLVLDDDDAPLYKGVILPPTWDVVIYPRQKTGLGGATNLAAEQFPYEPWYGWVGDDALPVSDGWDKALIDAAGKDQIAYCWEGGEQNHSRVGHFCLGGDLVRELGFIALPGLNRLYWDNALMEIGRRRKCVHYLPDVRVDHLHFSNGTAEIDETYHKPSATKDQELYFAWLRSLPVDDSQPIFCCVKAGTLYTAEYVNILLDTITRNLPDGYRLRFFCLTDSALGLDPRIEVLSLPKDLTTWWGKLYLFKAGLFPIGVRIHFFDLDTIVVGKLDEIVKYQGPFGILRDFYRGGKTLGPAIMLWESGTYHHIWDEWVAAGKPKTGHGDQWWLEQLDQGRGPGGVEFLQDLFPGDFCSYKVDCKPYPPVGTKVVCFHGDPRPHECDQDWVKLMWKIGGGNSLELEGIGNTHRTKIKANIEYSSSLPLKWFEPLPKHEGHAVLVAGGPSTKDYLFEVRRRYAEGQTIFAMNGSYDFLVKNFIYPHYHIIVDAQALNVKFITEPACPKYLLCSQVDPSIINAIRDLDRITLFHADIDETLESIPNRGTTVNLVSFGGTVGLGAMALTYLWGYRKIHLYGYDSSYKGTRSGHNPKHHAYDQPQNDGDRKIEVIAEGRKFLTTAWMVMQVQQFQILVNQLVKDDCIVTIRGDGLLPWVAQCMRQNQQKELANA